MSSAERNRWLTPNSTHNPNRLSPIIVIPSQTLISNKTSTSITVKSSQPKIQPCLQAWTSTSPQPIPILETTPPTYIHSFLFPITRLTMPHTTKATGTPLPSSSNLIMMTWRLSRFQKIHPRWIYYRCQSCLPSLMECWTLEIQISKAKPISPIESECPSLRSASRIRSTWASLS